MKRIALSFILFWLFLAAPAYATTYYASATGTGSTCSNGSPGTVVACLNVVSADDTLILKNGHYTGANYMMHGPTSRSGTAGHYITVTAETDGGVLIDGQGARTPLLWDHNSYWIVQGMDFANSDGDVVAIYPGSTFNIFRRIVAYNANTNANQHVWGIWQAPDNLLEDVAAFGTGRKMYESYETSGLTIRRPFGMWNRQDDDAGPFIVYSLSYNSDHVIIENPIGTRDEDAGTSCQPTNSPPCGVSDQGIFSMDRLGEYSDCEIHSGYYGGIGIILGSQFLWQDDNHGGEIHGGGVFGSLEFKDMALYMTPGMHTTQRRVLMTGYFVTGDGFGDGGCASTTLTANRKLTNISIIGDNDGSFPDLIDTTAGNNGWTQTNYHTGNSVSSVYTGSNNIYVNAGNVGATVYYQYIDGVLTSNFLWPWPMNARIKAAMTADGRTPFDVNANVFGIFGTPPNVFPGGSAPVDNFNSYTTSSDYSGANGGTGSWTAPATCDSTGIMSIETSPGGGEGGKSLKSATATGSHYCYREFTDVATDTFKFQIRSSTNSPNNTQYGYSLHESGVSMRTQVSIVSGSIKAYNYTTSAFVTVCSYTANTFQNVEEDLDAVGHPGQYRVRCGAGGTNTAWLGANGTMTIVNLMQFNDFATDAGHVLWFDGIGFTSTSGQSLVLKSPLLQSPVFNSPLIRVVPLK